MIDNAIPKGVLSRLESLNEGLKKKYNLDEDNTTHLGADLIFLDCPLGKIDHASKNTDDVLQEKLINNVHPSFQMLFISSHQNPASSCSFLGNWSIWSPSILLSLVPH